MVDKEEIRKRMDLFADSCREAGIKLTHQRLEIFREVAQSEGHPDAEAIYKGVRRRIPSISLDTVYRNLWLLVDLGLITMLGHSREHVRFDANTDPHHHYVCSHCGLTRDFNDKSYDRLSVPEEVKQMGSVEITHVEFRGLCSCCLHNNKTKKSKRRQLKNGGQL